MDYVICLCYSSEKGFYTKYSSAPSGEDEVIFRSHEQTGYRKHKISIPEAQIEIKISTNFGYGSMSYLIATISKREVPILDFSAEKLCGLNNAGGDFSVYLGEKLIAIIKAHEVKTIRIPVSYRGKITFKQLNGYALFPTVKEVVSPVCKVNDNMNYVID